MRPEEQGVFLVLQGNESLLQVAKDRCGQSQAVVPAAQKRVDG